MPAISADRKTYAFKLRDGLKYSDGSPVRASDFEHTIKRLTFLGGPFSSFVSGIVGAEAYQNAKKPNGDISGITADDETGEITVKLTQPDGSSSTRSPLRTRRRHRRRSRRSGRRQTSRA